MFNAKLKLSKIYLLSLAEQLELNTFLVENFCIGYIYFFKFLIAILVFFIKKKNGFLWLVQHYKTLNAIIVKNWYSLPLISELVSKLQDTWYFTKLDICWEFNNVYIKPEDEWKATFCTNYSLFKSLMMFFKHN